jgi:transposase
VLEPGRETPIRDRFFHDEANIRRFVSTLDASSEIRVCYEAGPTGYELARLLHRLGVACEVIACERSRNCPGGRSRNSTTGPVMF